MDALLIEHKVNYGVRGIHRTNEGHLAISPGTRLEVPKLPPRSCLYSLASIGVGTPHVESLAGYIARLGTLAEQVQAATQKSGELAWVDQGYTGREAAEAAAHGSELVVGKLAEAKRGFVRLSRRWVSNAPSLGWYVSAAWPAATSGFPPRWRVCTGWLSPV